jgi:hypothetical protein
MFFKGCHFSEESAALVAVHKELGVVLVYNSYVPY